MLAAAVPRYLHCNQELIQEHLCDIVPLDDCAIAMRRCGSC